MSGERFGPVDFDWFHSEEIPRRLGSRDLGGLRTIMASPASARLRPIAFSVGQGSYTYKPAAGARGLEVVPGDHHAETVVALSRDDWSDFCLELKTCYALFYADRLEFQKGNFGQLAKWEPVIRVAFDGQPFYDIDHPEAVLGSDGRPLDLERSFSLEDLMARGPGGTEDPSRDPGAFLRTAGFVHLRGVLDEAEMERIDVEVTLATARARPDDKRSWWTSVDGRDVCNRVNYLNEGSELIAGIGADERFSRIASLAGHDLKDASDRLDGNTLVIKVPGAETGLADLPWHRDCGMGGHPVKCPMLNVGIQLDAASGRSGQLEMIAGSHTGTSRLPGPPETGHLPVVAIATEPGDVTVHFGHTLHAAPPPSDRARPGRRALYLTYVPPLTFELVGPGQGYNDVLFTRDSGHIRHVHELRA